MAATEGLFFATAPAYDMVRIGLGFYGTLGVGIDRRRRWRHWPRSCVRR